MLPKTIQRTWQEYSNEEKLIAIEAYLDGMKSLENAENTHLQWLREHLPAHRLSDGRNYVFGGETPYQPSEMKMGHKDITINEIR